MSRRDGQIEGVRQFRRDDLDLEATPEPEPRIEWVREQVDTLPEDEMLVVSLQFFGGGSPTHDSVAADQGISSYKQKTTLERAIERLRGALQEEDGVGAVPAADPS